MSSSDPMERAAERIAIDYPVEILRMPRPSRSRRPAKRFDPHQPRDPGGEDGGQWISDIPGGGMTAEQFDERVKNGLDDTFDIEEATAFHDADFEMADGLTNYVGADGYAAKDQLRANGGNVDQLSGRVKECATGLDKAFAAQHPLERDIVVIRGIQDMNATFGGRDPGVGMTWIDHGWASTSANIFGHAFGHGDDGYTGDSGAQMRILVPKGAKAISHRNLTPGEVLLQRGYMYRVVRDNGLMGGIRQLDVEVIPR